MGLSKNKSYAGSGRVADQGANLGKTMNYNGAGQEYPESHSGMLKRVDNPNDSHGGAHEMRASYPPDQPHSMPTRSKPMAKSHKQARPMGKAHNAAAHTPAGMKFQSAGKKMGLDRRDASKGFASYKSTDTPMPAELPVQKGSKSRRRLT